MFEPLTKLKAKRQEKGLTMAQLGEKVGLSYRTIYQYEVGRRSPNLHTAKAIAIALDCKIDDII